MATNAAPAHAPPAGGALEEPPARHVRRALLVADLVESVRLVSSDEEGVVARWRAFVLAVRQQVLPHQGGRLVKSLGDGLLLCFERVDTAVAAALALQRLLPPLNDRVPHHLQIWLRIGLHVADVHEDELDLYGHGVNLTARLASLAQPGDVVLSVDVRDALVPGLDPECEDLGECYLKHIEEPVRAFRLVTPQAAQPGADADPEPDTGRGAAECPPLPPAAHLIPVVAVLPLRVAAGVDPAVAAVLSDDLAVALSRSGLVRGISRLSTLALAARGALPERAAVSGCLRADYLLEGAVMADGGCSRARLALIEARSGQPVWEGSLRLAASGDWAEATTQLVAQLLHAITSRQDALVHALAMPNLPSYSLLMAAVTRLHRLAGPDVRQARELLNHLVERHPRSADARTWLAKWHFLQVSQVTSADPPRDIGEARRQLDVARRQDPAHAMAAALEGHLHAFADRRLDLALATLEDTVQRSPNEPLAWLFLANVYAAYGRGADAVDAADRASGLSPVDPLRYFHDLFAARAHSVAGNVEMAVHYSRRSVRANGLHLSGLVELMINLVAAKQVEAARTYGRQYLALRPRASVRRYVEGHLCPVPAIVEREATALIAAGIPF